MARVKSVGHETKRKRIGSISADMREKRGGSETVKEGQRWIK